MYNINCDNCKTEFEAVEWEDGKCPYCSNKYTWIVEYEYTDLETTTPFFESKYAKINEFYLGEHWKIYFDGIE